MRWSYQATYVTNNQSKLREIYGVLLTKSSSELSGGITAALAFELA